MKRKVVQNITKNRTSLEQKLVWFLINWYKVELAEVEWNKYFMLADNWKHVLVKKGSNLRKIVTDLYNNL